MVRATRSSSPARVGKSKSSLSPSRRKGRSPSRGTGRQRSKSPAAKGGKASKSPSRKSPARKASKSPARKASKSPSRISTRPSRSPVPRGGKPPAGPPEKVVEKVSITTSTTPLTTTTTKLRTSTRLSQKLTPSQPAQIRDVTSGKTSGSKKNGWFSAVILTFFNLVLIPLVVFWALRVCSKEACEIIRYITIPRALATYLDVKAIVIYFGFLLFQLILLLVPVHIPGLTKSVALAGYHRFHCNGILAALISAAVYVGLHHFKHPLASTSLLSTHMVSSSIIFSLMLSVYLYIKAGVRPSYPRSSDGNTGNKLYDFNVGREVMPMSLWRRLDWKQFVMRIMPIMSIMISVSVLHKEVVKTGYSPNHAVVYIAVANIFVMLDYLWHEDQFLHSATVKHEGLGLQLIMSLVSAGPYISSLPLRYATLYLPHRSWFYLVGSGFIFFIGYFIYRGSTSQMYSTKVTHHGGGEHISGNHGKRILVSGWWGIVRRPNYLGTIIMSLAIALPCGFTHLFPWIYPILSTLDLVFRARREDDRCRKRYGSTWETYRQRTPNLIVPYLY